MKAPAPEPDLHHGVLEHINAGFCVIQVLFEGEQAVDYRFIEVNDAFERHTGLKGAQGKRMSALEPKHEREWFRIYGEVARTGKPAQFEMDARALGRSFAVDAVRVGKPGEDKVGILFFDVTARKQIEVELGESEARFSALADGLPMPVWVLDERGHARFVNSAFSEFFGGDETRVAEDVWRGLVHPDDASVFEYELQQALTVQRSMHALVRARRADGQWRWLEMNARPRFSRMGRFIGLAGSSPDVTERREIELAREELLQSERAARSAAENMARLKDEFLATLSHELRTPLTTILGWSELLLQRVDNTSPLFKGLNVIASSATAQKRLISDMLDLSSMLLGKVQLEVEVLDLRTQLGEALGAQEPVAEGKALDVSLQLPDQPCLVLGDATRLQQVFWNLLSNAIKFTPAEGRIEAQVRADGGYWTITLRDTGDGIAPEFLHHLFSRFRQADGTTTRRHGGLGLGLAIVQQLVELHGGTISAASDGHGHGSTFTVRLPQYLPDADRRPLREVFSGPILDPTVVEPHPLRGLHVLAVDDQPEVLEYLRRMLEEQGASVSAVGSAGEALALLADSGHLQYQVMLTDIGMPGMDGYGLVRTLREDMAVAATDLPAVAVTALARADDRRRALASGFQEHVAKPYSVAQLVSAVRSVQPQRSSDALH
ncbi:hybrid sensor histidine kinase/response regulator [Stenotrophomonas sp. SPM]|uniref:hybrid sensor histidine kinase/response regulator n=1 Tax=Stenotrophomonas sp. SPM TaxID=2170735 RepID=UPI000DE5EC61|nr:ATP-binding protein [Stenotrophomonas sp. SPM]PWB26330.1 hybrid sensor histidine kinase/response regulator [Stenotrophomonas sp. SPM]